MERRLLGYWFTPLARKPPSTTSTSPFTKADGLRREEYSGAHQLHRERLGERRHVRLARRVGGGW
jgi:hypothetical protein